MGTFTTWFDDMIGPSAISIAGASPISPRRQVINFVAGATAVDNPATGMTDVTITAASPTLGGDVMGPAASNTVVALQGRAVSSSAPTNGQVLQWVSGSSQWIPTTPASGSFTAGGDLTGTSSSQQVVSFTGSTGTLNGASSCTKISFSNSAASATLTQGLLVSGTGATFLLQAQSTSAGTGGLLALASGSGTGSGNVELRTGAVTQFRLTPSAFVSVTSLPYQVGTGTMPNTGFLMMPNTTGNHPFMTGRDTANTIDLPMVSADPGAYVLKIGDASAWNSVTVTALSLSFVASGSGTTLGLTNNGTGSSIFLETATVNFFDKTGTSTAILTLASAGTSSLMFAGTVTSAQLGQNSVSSSSAAPAFVIAASNNTSTGAGGDVSLTPGGSVGGGSNGVVNFVNAITSTTATAGAITPPNITGFYEVKISGTLRKLAIYAV